MLDSHLSAFKKTTTVAYLLNIIGGRMPFDSLQHNKSIRKTIANAEKLLELLFLHKTNGFPAHREGSQNFD